MKENKIYLKKLKRFIENYGFIITTLFLVAEILTFAFLIPIFYLPLETKEDTLFNVDLESDDYFTIELEFKKTYLYPYSDLFLKFNSDSSVDVYLLNYQQYINYLEIKNQDKGGRSII